MLNPPTKLRVYFYVDADFADLWNAGKDQNPLCAESCTEYLIIFMGCPLTWVSKIQTQISLSTVEAEYIAFSQSARELILYVRCYGIFKLL